MLIIPQRHPLVIAPVCLRPPPHKTDLRVTHKTSVASYIYINRLQGEDLHGAVDYRWKGADLLLTGREAPLRGPKRSLDGIALWQAADEGAYEHIPTHAVAFHAIGKLPPDLDTGSWREIVQNFCFTNLARIGMITDWAIHALPDEHGGWTKVPHVHLLITARSWRTWLSPGKRNPNWIRSKAKIRDMQDSWSELTSIFPDPKSTHRLDWVATI